MNDKNILQRLGRNITEIRKQRELTRANLSSKAKIDRSYLARIELGRANPSIKLLRKIAYSLKVRLSDLVKNL